jgi:transposase
MESSQPTRPYQLFVGIDVSARTVTLATQRPAQRASAARTFAQSPVGYQQLQAHLQAAHGTPAETLVVLEATGSYWITLATALVGAGFAVSVINPMQARHFAKALLQRAKTDALDAQLLAHLGATLQTACWAPPPAVYQELQQRLGQRDSLVAMRQQTRNQLHALQQHPVIIAAVRARYQALIATFDEQIAGLERELKQALQQDEAWAAAATYLQSVKGIGLLTTAFLLTSTLAFTACDSAAAATAYAGLAPVACDSGTSVHKRAVLPPHGHTRLRTALYEATFSACRYNPAIKEFFEQLLARGKPRKVARCAAARKLLHVAWAVVTKQQLWQPDYATASHQSARGA